jgi:hypothetical protein
VSLAPPLLLVDVDGVLSLYGTGDGNRVGALVDGVPHLFSPDAATALRGLVDAFECVWCTGWEERANEHLPPLLDLPSGWPYVPLGNAREGPHWKLAAIDAYAGTERPLAWIDDSVDFVCRAWAEARPGPTLLIATMPDVGLTAEHAAELLEWAVAVSRSD